MAWVIKDSTTGEYYRQRCGTHGWYSSDINNVRLYSDHKYAETTIKQAGHHVMFENRIPVIVEVKIAELGELDV